MTALLALLWDRLLGEPPARLHPVVWMGHAVRAFDRLRGRHDLILGGLMALSIPATFAFGAWLLPWWLGFVVCKCMFSLRMLRDAGLEVAAALEADDLPRARSGLRSLCSRDPRTLHAEDVASGAASSLAENVTDSVTAPFFWYAIGGLPAMVFYRAVNTMDAMIGYRDPRNEQWGKAAARLDDLLNLVPARLTALSIVAAAAVVPDASASGAFRAWRRDASKTPSPNGGHTMAAVAGALGVALSKPGVYVLGAPGAPPSAATIRETWRLIGGVGLGLALLFGVWR